MSRSAGIVFMFLSLMLAGNNVRFNSVPYGRPTDSVDSSRVLVWVE